MKVSLLLAAVGTLAIASTGFANETKIYEGQGGPLFDAVTVGGVTTPGVARFEIFVPDSGEIKDFKEIQLFGFAHTWAGDLQIILTHKDTGTSVVLLDRPGVPESTFGDSADFIAVNSYSWQDGGFVYDADVFAATIPSTVFGPVSGSLSDFAGENKFGVWSLVIIDNASGDTGALAGWAIVINNVPAPGALALLGLAGLTARRRRRSA